jgi:hypothetical protein
MRPCTGRYKLIKQRSTPASQGRLGASKRKQGGVVAGHWSNGGPLGCGGRGVDTPRQCRGGTHVARAVHGPHQDRLNHAHTVTHGDTRMTLVTPVTQVVTQHRGGDSQRNGRLQQCAGWPVRDGTTVTPHDANAAAQRTGYV